MSGGHIYERETSALPTVVSGGSLLPTPDVYGSAYGANPERVKTRTPQDRSIRLVDAVGALLPTPTAAQPGGTPEQFLARKEALGGACGVSVTDLRMALQLLPTPTSTDAAWKITGLATSDPMSRLYAGGSTSPDAQPPNPSMDDGSTPPS